MSTMLIKYIKMQLNLRSFDASCEVDNMEKLIIFMFSKSPLNSWWLVSLTVFFSWHNLWNCLQAESDSWSSYPNQLTERISHNYSSNEMWWLRMQFSCSTSSASGSCCYLSSSCNLKRLVKCRFKTGAHRSALHWRYPDCDLIHITSISHTRWRTARVLTKFSHRLLS